MFKPLKSSSIILVAAMLTFTLSFSVLQACVVFSGKPFDEQCKGNACVHQYPKVIKVACGLCSASEADDTTEDVVLNIKGMTSAGCESKVKKALSACKGVSDVKVSHKDGKADFHLEKGKASIEEIMEAVKKLGYTVTKG